MRTLWKIVWAVVLINYQKHLTSSKASAVILKPEMAQNHSGNMDAVSKNMVVMTQTVDSQSASMKEMVHHMRGMNMSMNRMRYDMTNMSRPMNFMNDFLPW